MTSVNLTATVYNFQEAACATYYVHIPTKHVTENSMRKTNHVTIWTQEDIAKDLNFSTGLLIGEWSRPLCSRPQVGRLMGPKPVAGEDQTGFSPDDRTPRSSYHQIELQKRLI